MKFGIFYELQVPRPWTPGAEKQVYDNALEQVRLADELGFDYVWAVEHHFLEEYSHCSSPELFLTACAMVTKQIHVGHGIVICVPQFNHPIRVAERAAVLDILSGGRLEFGTGRSSTWSELGGFQANPDETKQTWDEYVHAIPKMWTRERYSHQGMSFSMPERAVLPKPVQKPHPRMWVAVSSPGTDMDAADRGLGCLGVSPTGFEDQGRRVEEYHRRVRQCEPAGEVVCDEIATLNYLYCHEDNDYARRVGGAAQGAFGVANANLVFTREAYPTSAYQFLGNLAPAPPAQDRSGPDEQRPMPPGSALGDPDHCVEQIRRWESVGVDAINFLLNGMEVIPQHEVLESLRLFAREVMPKFGKGAYARQAATVTGAGS